MALRTLWSVKGGSGVSVTSAGLAVALSRAGRSTVLVDLVGDQPAALGLPEPDGPGWKDWLATADRNPEVLSRLVVPVADGLALLPSGRDVASSVAGVPGSHESFGPCDPGAGVAATLAALGSEVVVDAGRRGADTPAAFIDAVAAAGRSVLVTRACYLSLRRIVRTAVRPDAVALVLDPGRALDRRDVAEVTGLPVDATIEVDPAVARSVDAGLLVRRPNRAFSRALGGLA